MKKLKKLAEILKIYDKNLTEYAASLSFHTLLSLLPILMLSFAIFTKMPSFSEYYAKIKTFIFSNLMPSNQEIFSAQIESFLQNSDSLGVAGLIAIIFTSFMFFIDFETIIRKISNAPKRGFFRSLSSYWTLLTLAPLGLGGSFYVSGILQNLLNQNEITSWINLALILPYLIIWAIFAVVYAVCINLEISAKNILIASFISSICWNILKFGFIQYAFYNKTYLSIYGSFSVLLFFFVWIYLGWILFLYGVKICVFLNEKDRQNAQNSGKKSENFKSNT